MTSEEFRLQPENEDVRPSTDAFNTQVDAIETIFNVLDADNTMRLNVAGSIKDLRDALKSGAEDIDTFIDALYAHAQGEDTTLPGAIDAVTALAKAARDYLAAKSDKKG